MRAIDSCAHWIPFCIHILIPSLSLSFCLKKPFKCHYYFATHQKGSENEIANTSRNYPLGVSMKNGSLGLKSNSFYLLFEWREKKSNAQPVIMYNNIIVNKNGVALPLSKSFAHTQKHLSVAPLSSTHSHWICIYMLWVGNGMRAYIIVLRNEWF